MFSRSGIPISSMSCMKDDGVNGINLSDSSARYVRDMLFIVASTSHNIVESSSKLSDALPSVLSKRFFTERMSRSHHPPHHAAVGGDELPLDGS